VHDGPNVTRLSLYDESQAVYDAVVAFADAWVKHASQTTTVRDPEALRAWVLWNHGGWACRKLRAHSWRPTQLVDMAKFRLPFGIQQVLPPSNGQGI
jgi:hypothetical protein